MSASHRTSLTREEQHDENVNNLFDPHNAVDLANAFGTGNGTRYRVYPQLPAQMSSRPPSAPIGPFLSSNDGQRRLPNDIIRYRLGPNLDHQTAGAVACTCTENRKALKLRQEWKAAEERIRMLGVALCLNFNRSVRHEHSAEEASIVKHDIQTFLRWEQVSGQPVFIDRQTPMERYVNLLIYAVLVNERANVDTPIQILTQWSLVKLPNGIRYHLNRPNPKGRSLLDTFQRTVKIRSRLAQQRGGELAVARMEIVDRLRTTLERLVAEE